MTVLNSQDNGRTVDVKAQSIVTVCLKENPTTGYRWKIETADGLGLIDDSFEKLSDSLGASGIRILKFRTPEAGVHKLSIRNWRDWEGESSIIDRFDVLIEVK